MQRKSIQIYLLFLGLIFIANESIHGFESIDPLNRLHLVARDNCGMNGAQPHLISGSNWTFAPEEIDTLIVDSNSPLRSVAHGEKVVFLYRGLYPGAVYKLRIHYLSDNHKRVQNVFIDGIKLQDHLELIAQKPMEVIINVPNEATNDGNIELTFEKISGPNAIVSEIELWSNKKELQPALEIQAFGDFRGKVVGTVLDCNNGRMLEGISVQAMASGKILAESKSDSQGRFILNIRENNLVPKTDNIDIISQLDGKRQSIRLAAQEIFYLPLVFKAVPQLTNGIRKNRINLNGKWKFNPAPSPNFWKEADYQNWADISVPGEWVMQGFSVEPNTAAGYYRNFNVPGDWSGNRIILRCDAVYSDAKVFINSREVGRHRGGMTPFEFDVTDFIKTDSENNIALAVKNESIEDTLGSLTQYAAHQLGGVTRKIYLFAVPQVHLANMHFETAFDDYFENATLKLKAVLINNSGNVSKNGKLVVELIDPFGKKFTTPEEYTLPEIPGNDSKDFTIEIPVTRPQKWDAEHPNLYTIRTHLQTNGKFTETYTQKIGFREIEVRGNQVLVNGNVVKLRGINRHEVHPLLGRSLKDSLWRKDAKLFRDANMNYIRTSHYPPAEEFISYCDSIGLFVELEAPFVWMGHAANATWQERNAYDLKFFSSIIRGLSETINHYYNHPSVLIWSMANESAWNRNWERAHQLTNLLDPTRPKSFHDQAYGGYNNFGSTEMEIANMHYPGPGGPEYVKDFTRPLLFGEYCHLNTYNRQEIVTDPGVRDYYGVALAPMWENMHTSKGCLGGAIWSGVDDVFELPDGRAVGYGEWGPIDGWRRKKPEYWHIKKAYSPIRLIHKNIELPDHNKPIQIEVTNWHDFTDFNEIKIEWQIGKETGTVKTNIAPHESGIITIEPKNELRDEQILNLRFVSPRNFIIDSFNLPIGKSEPKEESRPVAKMAEAPFKLISEENRIVIQNEEQEFVIDRQSGMLTSGKRSGKPILTGGPHLMLLALISGPCSTEHSGNIVPFNDLCANWQASSVSIDQNANEIILTVRGAYDQAEGLYVYNFSKDGTVKLDYNFKSKIELEPRQMGLVLDLNEKCQTLEWNRKAQWTDYPDNHIGRPLGIANAFPLSNNKSDSFRKEPGHAWAYDYHPFGCNDFRATRRNIYQVKLHAEEGYGIEIDSDGSQHSRAFIDGGKSHLLIAGYDTGGADIFLSAHYEKDRIKIKPGMDLTGGLIMRLID